MAANVVCAVKNAIRDALSELGPQQPYFALSTCLHVMAVQLHNLALIPLTSL